MVNSSRMLKCFVENVLTRLNMVTSSRMLKSLNSCNCGKKFYNVEMK